MEDVIEGLKEAIRKAINIMWAEGTLQHKYDHTWIMMTMNETEWLPSFATPTEYLDYMEGCGVRDRLPERSNIVKYYDRARGYSQIGRLRMLRRRRKSGEIMLENAS